MFRHDSYTVEISNRPLPRGVWVGPDTLLGCRFQVGVDGTRQQVIKKYRAWLWQQLHMKGPVHAKVLKLSHQAGVMNLTLICRCSLCPQHARVIKNCLEWMQVPGNYELFMRRLENPPGYNPDWTVDVSCE